MNISVNIFVKKFVLAQLACAVVGVGLAASAFAEAPLSAGTNPTLRAGILATYSAYQETRMDLAGGYLEKLAKRNLDVLVAEGCERLRQTGDVKLALQLQREWDQQVSTVLTTRLNALAAGEVGTLELGDFDPLSAWLDNFYNTLYYKTKGIVKGIRVIHDVYLMNYALAVVLKPNGAWRTRTNYDRIEYRKHFIPFSNTVTYWASLKACQRYLPAYKKYCTNGAGYLEKFMGKHVAPHLSDRVFALVSHSHSTGPVNAPAPVMDELDYSVFENEMLIQSENSALLEE